MKYETFVVGSFLTNCYLTWCTRTKEAIIIDPGFNQQIEYNRIFRVITEEKLKINCIVNSHGHPDHTSGNNSVKQVFKVPILIHEKDKHLLTDANVASTFLGSQETSKADKTLRDGDKINYGDVTLKVLHTPGHSQGSVSLVGPGIVFTGDTLFAGSIGRVDLPGGSGKQILNSLRYKLMVLPDESIVLPGHGPGSTIGKEKRFNPYLQKDFDVSFLC